MADRRRSLCGEAGGEGFPSSPNPPGPRLAAQGAQLLVSISAFWTSAHDWWDPATVQNAKLSNLWLAASNQVGAIGHGTCIGHSRVVDPLGRIVCDAGTGKGLIIWSTDVLIDASR